MNVLSTSFCRMSLKNNAVKHIEIHSYIVKNIIKNKVKPTSTTYTQLENNTTFQILQENLHEPLWPITKGIITNMNTKYQKWQCLKIFGKKTH